MINTLRKYEADVKDIFKTSKLSVKIYYCKAMVEPTDRFCGLKCVIIF
jgi:hypothetical protein